MRTDMTELVVAFRDLFVNAPKNLEKCADKIFVRKLLGKRPFAKPIHRLGKNIKMDGVSWGLFSTSSGQGAMAGFWFCKTVMNFGPHDGNSSSDK
jgi:hypothetical protein